MEGRRGGRKEGDEEGKEQEQEESGRELILAVIRHDLQSRACQKRLLVEEEQVSSARHMLHDARARLPDRPRRACAWLVRGPDAQWRSALFPVQPCGS